MKIPDEILAIAQQIITQDNLCTADPVFLIQKKEKHPAPDGWSDDYYWTIDGEEATEEEAGKLEEREENSIGDGQLHRFFDNTEKVYYIERWTTVMPFFTRKGAEDYLAVNGHNISGETRIYVDSLWRNFEMQAVRNFLISLAASEEGK